MIFFIFDLWFGGVMGSTPVVQSVAPLIGRVLVYAALEGEVSLEPAVDDARASVYPLLIGNMRGR